MHSLVKATGALTVPRLTGIGASRGGRTLVVPRATPVRARIFGGRVRGNGPADSMYRRAWRGALCLSQVHGYGRGTLRGGGARMVRRETAIVARPMWSGNELYSDLGTSRVARARAAGKRPGAWHSSCALAHDLGVSNPRLFNYDLGSIDQSLLELAAGWARWTSERPRSVDPERRADAKLPL